jgi:oxalate---CoA ligase
VTAATGQGLGGFHSERLAPFKTPRKILLVAEIPNGATGKLQRIGLAQKLGLG